MDYSALIEDIKNAEREYERIQRMPKMLRITDETDLEQEVLDDIESVVVEKGYEKIQLDLYAFENLKSLSIYEKLSWDQVKDIDFAWLNNIDINVPDNQKPEKIDAFYLKELRVGFVSSEEHRENEDFFQLDFSGCSEVETLRLNQPNRIDLQCLGRLKHLKRLIINEFMQNAFVIPELSELEEISLSGRYYEMDLGWSNVKKLSFYSYDITDYSFLEKCKNIESLDISCEGELDLSIVESMPNLRKLRVRRGHVINEERLRTLQLEECIITPRDWDLQKLSIKTMPFYRFINFIHRQDEEPSEFELRRRKAFPELANQSREERIAELVQGEFSNMFRAINPFADFNEYSPDYKSIYIEKSIEKYPFLHSTKEMRHQIKREAIPLAEYIRGQEMPGRIVYIDNDILTIGVKYTEGSGEMFGDWELLYNGKLKERFFEKARTVLPEYNLYKYDFEIKIVNYYGNSFDKEHCLLPILIAIRSAMTGTPIRLDMALTGYYSRRGNMCEPDFIRRKISAAHVNRFSEIVIAGKKTKIEIEDIQIARCKTEREIIDTLFCENS